MGSIGNPQGVNLPDRRFKPGFIATIIGRKSAFTAISGD
jgi:hypothetical protein